MTVSLQALTIAGAPVLLAAPAHSPAPLPTVLWFHGFRADALAHAAELERCADAGFLAVGVDVAGHGARHDPTIGSWLATTAGGAMAVMLPLVDESIAELPALIAELVATHGADASRVSLVGISMGAFLAYRAIATALPLRAVVALLGSPQQLGANSPHEAIDQFRDVALLSITAEYDVSVPPEPTRAFHAALAARFGASDRHHHHVLAGAGHLTSSAQWAEAMQLTMDWLHTKAR